MAYWATLPKHLPQRLADGEDDAVAGRLGAALGAAHAHGLAGDEAGVVPAVDRLELVEHPQHVLAGGHDVGGGHVGHGTDVPGELAHPASADLLLLALREVVGVADDAALAAAERDVHHRAFPGHPGGEGADGVERLLRVEADAALRGAAGVVVLHAEAAEDLDPSVVHADGNREAVLPQRPAEQLAGGRVEIQDRRHLVELRLCHLECIHALDRHDAGTS
jgi:hypothetical protein